MEKLDHKSNPLKLYLIRHYSPLIMLLILIVALNNICCSISQKTIIYNELPKSEDSLTIKEGFVSRVAQLIKYKRNGQLCAYIELSEPIKVAQAENNEEWGYFQFPSIGKSEDGTLIVTWEMAEDSYKSYGNAQERKVRPMMSKDNGMTWVPQDKNCRLYNRGYNVYLKNGDELSVITPKARNIHSYDNFPKVIGKNNNYTFFQAESLPDELKGIYLKYVKKEDNKTNTFHAKLIDPGALRYAIDSMMPIVWWGNIKEQADMSLIAGVYPTYYKDSNGKVSTSCVSFYCSKDVGQTWEIRGKIPFRPDGIADIRGNGRYEEPAFEVLKDSSFICVMRSGSLSPMYKTFSFDRGKSWTEPIPFTPNGVMPRLFLLKNGVLVLLSGRPGIQIRFSFDGTGRTWSDPIEMIPYTQSDGSIIQPVSCGYASFIEAGDDSFYMVYSDFTTKNVMGNVRKSIWFRKVIVRK